VGIPERSSTSKHQGLVPGHGSAGCFPEYVKFFTFAQPPSAFTLDSGRKISPVTLAYETYGRLNPTRDNVILVAHALTGDSHVVAHTKDDRKGWWEGLVGPGRALDTNRYFIVCSNVLGGCRGSTGPSSINPATGREYAMDFPVITIRDMVRAQRRLLDFLGIRKLVAVIGGSMGGMQALEWAVAYPGLAGRILNIAAPARHSPQSIAYHEVGRQAIMRDPNWCRGNYYGQRPPEEGLSLARMVGMITYQSNESMELKFGRHLEDPTSSPFDFTSKFKVESYLWYQGECLVRRFDANSYLFLTRAMDLFDLGRGRGGLKRALKRIQSEVWVVGISSDILYPVEEMRELYALMRVQGVDAHYEELKSPFGHDAFLVETRQVEVLMKRFLERECVSGVS